MRRHLTIISTLLTIALTSCSSLSNSGLIQHRDKDYLNAKSIPALKIPNGLSSSTIHAHYPVSDTQFPESDKSVNLTPPNLVKPVASNSKSVFAEKEQAQSETPQEIQASNSYFDRFTRSTHKGGEPVGSVMKSVWPTKKTEKNTTQSQNITPAKTTTNVTGNDDPNASTMPRNYYDRYSHR